MNNILNNNMTDDELDILESKLASSVDAVVESQKLIQLIKENRNQAQLPLDGECESPQTERERVSFTDGGDMIDGDQEHLVVVIKINSEEEKLDLAQRIPKILNNEWYDQAENTKEELSEIKTLATKRHQLLLEANKEIKRLEHANRELNFRHLNLTTSSSVKTEEIRRLEGVNTKLNSDMVKFKKLASSFETKN